jgi:hypothetical protein
MAKSAFSKTRCKKPADKDFYIERRRCTIVSAAFVSWDQLLFACGKGCRFYVGGGQRCWRRRERERGRDDGLEDGEGDDRVKVLLAECNMIVAASK